MTASTTLRTIQVWKDSLETQVCRGADCRARIVMATVVTSGARMPFNAPVTPISEYEVGLPGMERTAITVDHATNHFAHCPNADEFRRPRS